MLTVISAIIYASVVLIAILLIVLVLVQPSKGGGFGSAFGGIGESVFGAQAMGQLSKLTIYLLALFFILTLTLAVLTGHKAAKKSLISSDKTAIEAPAQSGTAAETKDAPKETAATAKDAAKNTAAATKDAVKDASKDAKAAVAAPVAKQPAKK